MINIRLLALILCLGCLQPVTSFAKDTCSSIFSQSEVSIHISKHDAKIATPESLSLVREMMRSLDQFEALTKKTNDPRSKMYSKAMHIITDARARGKQILENKASDQDQVFDFFKLTTFLIDLPKTYTNEIGHYADGFESVNRYSRRALQTRLDEFNNRFKTGGADVVLQGVIKNKPRITSTDLKDGFQYISLAPNGDIPYMRFPFQYKYIFREGLLTMVDLFKDRERGITYVGISKRDFAPYDGQYGDGEAFTRHDRLHSFTQKYFDYLLFKEFKAYTTEQMIALKQRTNALLQARIAEYQSLPNKELRDAIEIWFFTTLHEQSKSYPIGVEADFKMKGGVQYYKDAIPTGLKEGRFGEEYKYLLDKPEVLDQAFEWLQSRAKKDAKTLRSKGV